jgi:hypothetical protein
MDHWWNHGHDSKVIAFDCSGGELWVVKFAKVKAMAEA